MTKNQSKEVRIAQIIDAAVLEFVEKGYEGASMASIAKRASLTKGGLYHHFSSKDDILIAANNRYMEPVFVFMEKARTNPSPVSGLKEYIRDYLFHWAAHPVELEFSFLSLAKTMSSKEMWPVMDEYLNMVIAFYEDLLNHGILRGELKKHDTNSRAVALASAMDGVTGYLVICKKITPEKTTNQFIDVYITEIETKKLQTSNSKL
ncbi:MAG: TetR/AcrR family transcriptional regulator [bacterium]|nr:TetR/AcrR family transcriptional regulator [bacterium]